jgi:hypothetical protein
MKRAPDKPQHLVTKLVSMGVINILEMVDIRKMSDRLLPLAYESSTAAKIF